jgi:hypothetical protein
MPDNNFTIVAIDAPEIAQHYDEVGARAEDAHRAFDDVLTLLEDTHAAHFDKLRGRYVLTGATRASLTQRSAAGAIRQAHAGGALFGTQVEQAHYLTKAPRDPDNGQVEKHNGKGLSAVLVLSRVTKKRIAEIVTDFIAEPFGAA